MAVSFENSRFFAFVCFNLVHVSFAFSPFYLENHIAILCCFSPQFTVFWWLNKPTKHPLKQNPLSDMTATLTLQISESFTSFASVSSFLYVIPFDSFAYNREINSTEFWVSNNQSNRSGVLSIFVYEKLSLAGDFLTRDSRGRKMMKNAKEWVRRLKIIVVQKIARNINYWRTLISFHLTTMELFAVFFFFCHWWSSFCRSTIMCRSQHEWVMTHMHKIAFPSQVQW